MLMQQPNDTLCSVEGCFVKYLIVSCISHITLNHDVCTCTSEFHHIIVFIAADSLRPILQNGVDEMDDYINAVYVNVSNLQDMWHLREWLVFYKKKCAIIYTWISFLNNLLMHLSSVVNNPDRKVHGANMGPTWVLSAQMGTMLAPWTLISGNSTGFHANSWALRTHTFTGIMTWINQHFNS